MDEKTNQKIEELKKNPPNRVLPVMLLAIALLGTFFYRVATTAPGWEPQPAPTPTRPAPKAAAQPAAQPAQTTAAVATTTTTAPAPAATATAPTEAAPAATTEDAAPAAQPAETTVATTGETTTSDETTTAPETDPGDEAALDAYLAEHLGQEVPFLYKGETRTVTLAAFSEETVTIKRKKSFTMKRTALTPEQLALWK